MTSIVLNVKTAREFCIRGSCQSKGQLLPFIAQIRNRFMKGWVPAAAASRDASASGKARHRLRAQRPRAERLLHQEAVVVLRLRGDLAADPGRQLDRLVDILQFDFRNDQAEVLARENVDLPREVAVEDTTWRVFSMMAPSRSCMSASACSTGMGYSNSSRRRSAGRDFDGERRGSIAADANPGRRLCRSTRDRPAGWSSGLKRARASRCHARGTCVRSRNSLAHAMPAAKPGNPCEFTELL